MSSNKNDGLFAGVKAQLTAEDKQFLEGILGADVLGNLQKSAETRGKALEDAGIGFKAGDGDVSVDAAILLAANVKVWRGMAHIVQQFADNTGVAAKIVEDNADAIGGLETKVERLSKMIMALLEPKSPRKSRGGKASPQDETDIDALFAQFEKAREDADAKDKDGKDDKRPLSFLEKISIAAGDDPDNYDS